MNLSNDVVMNYKILRWNLVAMSSTMWWSLDYYIIPVSSTDSLTTQQHRVDKMSDSLLCLLTS